MTSALPRGLRRLETCAMTRTAAMTTARRIAQEMGVALGGTVGYHVRYDRCTSSSTVIKVRLDGDECVDLLRCVDYAGRL